MSVQMAQKFRIMTRVVVKGIAAVGCRPAIRPEGTVVEVREGGVVRVQFEDGSRRWFREEELLQSAVK